MGDEAGVGACSESELVAEESALAFFGAGFVVAVACLRFVAGSASSSDSEPDGFVAVAAGARAPATLAGAGVGSSAGGAIRLVSGACFAGGTGSSLSSSDSGSEGFAVGAAGGTSVGRTGVSVVDADEETI